MRECSIKKVYLCSRQTSEAVEHCPRACPKKHADNDLKHNEAGRKHAPRRDETSGEKTRMHRYFARGVGEGGRPLMTFVWLMLVACITLINTYVPWFVGKTKAKA